MSRDVDRFVPEIEKDRSGNEPVRPGAEPGVAVLFRSNRAHIDRRRRPRQNVSLEVVLLSPSDRRPVAKGRILDLGLGGIQVWGLGLGEGVFEWKHAPLVPGTVVLLALNQPHGGDPLVVHARVRWRRYENLGLSFFAATRETEQRLLCLMAIESRNDPSVSEPLRCPVQQSA